MPRTAIVNAALCVLAVSIAMALGFGFTVDDALISTRVAYHLGRGAGYRFNPAGDVVDCVTPLGWAHVLAPFAMDPWLGLRAARAIGIAATLAWALVLGAACRDVPQGRLSVLLVPLALCLPVGAWSVSGMETPVVTLFVALSLGESRWRLGCASLAAALRPELIPFALVLAVLSPVRDGKTRMFNAALALSGPATVAALRVVVFGHPAPLAVFAKPQDFSSGVFYAIGGCLWLGLPLLLVSYRGLRSAPPRVRGVAVAVLAHVFALVLAGGDWMALFRLFVPIVPALMFVAADLVRRPGWPVVAARSALSTLVCVWLLLDKGPAARGVWDNRQALSVAAAPHLEGATKVASLDVGWVGATTRASIVDLAGVTDPEVAWLPGGHTSKRLPRDFLLRRAPESLVLLLAPGIGRKSIAERKWTELPFARFVEQRVALLDGAGDFVPVASLPLAGTEQRYLVLRRLSERLTHAPCRAQDPEVECAAW